MVMNFGVRCVFGVYLMFGLVEVVELDVEYQLVVCSLVRVII